MYDHSEYICLYKMKSNINNEIFLLDFIRSYITWYKLYKMPVRRYKGTNRHILLDNLPKLYM
jgi:hypothetical protein